jgi:hypothetical protein
VETISRASIIEFLEHLGEQIPFPATFYLLGGSALCLLGSPRETLDVDYTTDLDTTSEKMIETIIQRLASQLKLDIEAVPIAEFIPLPPDTQSRRRFVGHYGALDVYIYDLYSIALSKIARGFESDIEDVLFLLKQKLISFENLEHFFHLILPETSKSDIDRNEFSKYFGELRNLWEGRH